MRPFFSYCVCAQVCVCVSEFKSASTEYPHIIGFLGESNVTVHLLSTVPYVESSGVFLRKVLQKYNHLQLPDLADFSMVDVILN